MCGCTVSVDGVEHQAHMDAAAAVTLMRPELPASHNSTSGHLRWSILLLHSRLASLFGV